MSNPYEPPKSTTEHDRPRRRNLVLIPQFRFWAGLGIAIFALLLLFVASVLTTGAKPLLAKGPGELVVYTGVITFIIGAVVLISSATRVVGTGRSPKFHVRQSQPTEFSVDVLDVSHNIPITNSEPPLPQDYSVSRGKAFVALISGLGLLGAGFILLSAGVIGPIMLALGVLSTSIGFMNLVFPDSFKKTPMFGKVTLLVMAIGIFILAVVVLLIVLHRLGFRLGDV